MRDDGPTRFTELVLPHLGEARALAQWITGNPADADDVLQDACLLALRTVWRIAGGDGRSWLLTVVRNAAFTWLRKNRSAAFVPFQDVQAVDGEPVQVSDADDETPESVLIAKAAAACVGAAIARLPAPFREALLLRDVRGLSYREISELTSVPIGTVMSRLARGRSRVIKLLLKNRRNAVALAAPARGPARSASVPPARPLSRAHA